MNWKTALVVLGAASAALTFGASQASAQANAKASDAQMKRGKMLWTNRGCSSCHGIGKLNAGPDLAGLEQRRSQEWIVKWLKDTDVMLASDSTAQAMLAEWKGIRMPKQNMSDQDIQAILAYLRAEEAKIMGKK
jgi:mono/diheme cytochrome c family protein